MSKFSKRMAAVDVQAIIKELDRWALGELGSDLRWKTLEDQFGFTRQALSARLEIKVAFDVAKKSLSGGLASQQKAAVQSTEELTLRVRQLEQEVLAYKEREARWHLRWQQIAYNVRARFGAQMSNIDIAVGSKEGLPNLRATDSILKQLDQPIPPVGSLDADVDGE